MRGNMELTMTVRILTKRVLIGGLRNNTLHRDQRHEQCYQLASIVELQPTQKKDWKGISVWNPRWLLKCDPSVLAEGRRNEGLEHLRLSCVRC